jgi:hypothetical protein
MKNYKKKKLICFENHFQGDGIKLCKKSTTFTTIFRVKKCYYHYDFVCKKVPLSSRYAKIVVYLTSFTRVLKWPTRAKKGPIYTRTS